MSSYYFFAKFRKRLFILYSFFWGISSLWHKWSNEKKTFLCAEDVTLSACWSLDWFGGWAQIINVELSIPEMSACSVISSSESVLRQQAKLVSTKTEQDNYSICSLWLFIYHWVEHLNMFVLGSTHQHIFRTPFWNNQKLILLGFDPYRS